MKEVILYSFMVYCFPLVPLFPPRNHQRTFSAKSSGYSSYVHEAHRSNFYIAMRRRGFLTRADPASLAETFSVAWTRQCWGDRKRDERDWRWRAAKAELKPEGVVITRSVVQTLKTRDASLERDVTTKVVRHTSGNYVRVRNGDLSSRFTNNFRVSVHGLMVSALSFILLWCTSITEFEVVVVWRCSTIIQSTQQTCFSTHGPIKFHLLLLKTGRFCKWGCLRSQSAKLNCMMHWCRQTDLCVCVCVSSSVLCLVSRHRARVWRRLRTKQKISQRSRCFGEVEPCLFTCVVLCLSGTTIAAVSTWNVSSDLL